MKLTSYAIKRDHSDAWGFYRVDVPEVGQRGIGFQWSWRGVVRGVSLVWVRSAMTGRR